MRPVGPQPPSVYWVRRALALVVVIGVVVAAVWLVSGRGGDGTPSAAAGPATSPSTAPVASPSPSPSHSSTKKATSTPTPSRSVTATSSPDSSASTTQPRLCKDSEISVTASTDAATYPVGATPRLRMKILNTSASACRRDVGAAANEVIVNKGSTRFWSSDDCNPPGKADVVALAAGQSYSVTLGWLGHASQPTCPPNQPAATAGSYNLVGRNGDLMSAPEPFSLT